MNKHLADESRAARLVFVTAVLTCCLGAIPQLRVQQPQPPPNALTNANASASYPCVVVTGAVRTPARVELRRRTTLLEAIVAADGFAENSGTTIRIVHRGVDAGCRDSSPKVQDGTPSNSQTLSFAELGRTNPELQDGDVVLVSEAEQVYVVGNVVRPRAILLRTPLTLNQALTLAGGILQGARTDKIRLIRQGADPSARTQTVVNLKAIWARKAVDPVLQANDIIDVPAKRGDRYRLPPGTTLLQAPQPTRVIY